MVSRSECNVVNNQYVYRNSPFMLGTSQRYLCVNHYTITLEVKLKGKASYTPNWAW